MYTDDDKKPGDIPDMLLPIHMAKSLGAMKAPCAVKRITFRRTEAIPGDTLYVSVPKLNENEGWCPAHCCCALTLTWWAGTPTTSSFRTLCGRSLTSWS